MMKPVSIVLALGLLVLTVVGWATMTAASWLAWFDLVGAICAFWVAFGTTNLNARIGGPVALGIGLLVLWIIAESSMGVPEWQAWWTFAFGIAFVGLGIADYFMERGGAGTHVRSPI